MIIAHHKKFLAGMGVAGGVLIFPLGWKLVGGLVIAVALIELAGAFHRERKK